MDKKKRLIYNRDQGSVISYQLSVISYQNLKNDQNIPQSTMFEIKTGS